jgi:hypothetical protein
VFSLKIISYFIVFVPKTLVGVIEHEISDMHRHYVALLRGSMHLKFEESDAPGNEGVGMGVNESYLSQRIYLAFLVLVIL